MQSVSNGLFAAVRAGNREAVREVLERSPESAAARDQDGATPLHYATESGDRGIVAMLLDAGADLNARDLPHATRMVEGTARSMGITVEG